MTGLRPPAPEAVTIRQLLDRGYTQAAGTALRAVYNSTNGSSTIMQRRLAELAAEAERLAEAGERLTPENAILRALVADFDDVMNANRVIVDSVAGDVQASGAQVAGQAVRAGALPGITDAHLGRVGVTWNQPDPEAIRALVDYTTSDEWQTRLARYGEGVPTLARNTVVRGMLQGYGPRRMAKDLQSAVENLPAAYANTIMRTLQQTSYRDAAVAHRVANSHIITEQIRIAALDHRTCMACVALHGTRLPLDERVNDHHNGRCDSITVVRGRPEPNVESGEAWFARQPEDAQRAMMGESAWRAWKGGAFQLSDYPRTYSDPVFGEMIAAHSLKGMLGPQAARYYGGAQ